MREIERVVLLKVIDAKWMDHIDDMDQLRQGIGLQAYGQRDPKVEYKMIGYEMFDEMTRSIRGGYGTYDPACQTGTEGRKRTGCKSNRNEQG